MRFPLILAALMLGLLTGCATVIDSTISDPISDNRGSRTAGQFLDDQTTEIAIAVNLKRRLLSSKSAILMLRHTTVSY